MKKKRPLQLFSLFLFTFLLFPSLLSATESVFAVDGTPGDEMAEEEQPAAESQAILAEIYSHISEIPKRLIDLQDTLDDIVDASLVRTQLPPLEKSLEDLSWQVTLEKSNPSLTFGRLADLVAKAESYKRQLQTLQEPVTESLSILASEEKFWQAEKEQVQQWLENAKEENSLQLVLSDKESLLQTIDGALEKVNTRLLAVVGLSREINALQVQLYSLNGDLQDLIQDLRDVHIQQTAPSVLSPQFYRPINRELFQKSWHNVVKTFQLQLRFIQQHVWVLLFGLALVSILSVGIGRSRRLVHESSHWFSFSRRPVATALFTCLSLFLLATIFFTAGHLTTEVAELFYILTVLTVTRISAVLLDRWLYRHLLIPMLLLLMLTLVLQMIHIPGVLLHLYIFSACVFGLWLFLKNMIWHRKEVFGLRRFFIYIDALFCLVVTGAEIFGYSAIALYLFRSFLYSVIAALMFWMLFLVSEGMLELLFLRVPIKFLRKNSATLVRQCVPALALCYGLLFLLLSLVIWQAYPTIEEATKSFINLGFFIGSFKITPGYILMVILVIYGSYLVSSSLQALLLQEILPRYGAESGVQLSITRLVHYAVIVLGFLVLLRALGLELNKLAILGGALGVGIGFGLQAIVNNFVSGLILLFERPIKVGDMIQVGTEIGEVKNLGLRATVVRTYDNSDIVIPNSDLITGQVTNWTLADRQVRVKVPVGVAYGTDIAKVLEILLTCADNNPMVLSQPKPTALFLAFGNSSLDFLLRVWIIEADHRLQVLSELNQDIEAEFTLAGIEIPFPQTDLHLRSVDESILKQGRPLRAER